jgi:hypothetical protein
MLSALEFPGLFKDLFEGFLAIIESNPGVAVSAGTREPDCKIPRHTDSLSNSIIPFPGFDEARTNRVVPRKVTGLPARELIL